MNIDAFYKLSYGLYLIGSKSGDKINAHVSNTVFQVTSEPMTIAVCSNKQNLTTDYINESGVISISVLSEDADLKFIGKFGFKSGRAIDKFETTQYRTAVTGAPIVLEKTIAYFDCKVINTIDVGTHVLFIVQVVDYDILNAEQTPLTYKYYREVIKGLSPKTAPTYLDKSMLGH